MTLEQLKYPIGKYSPISTDEKVVEKWTETIRDLPTLLTEVLQSCPEECLTKQYRPNSWTIRQVVHHLADSHVNAYVRMRRTLTEEQPLVVPYNERKWALLPDTALTPVHVSVDLLTAVHHRMYQTIKHLTSEELSRTYLHPDFPTPNTMAYLIGMYAWHGLHHIGHIKLALTT